jgi:hypothetical protein
MRSHPKGISFGAYRLAFGEHFVKKLLSGMCINCLQIKLAPCN